MRISVPVIQAPSSDTSMAMTPAIAAGSAIPAPLDSTVVGRIGMSRGDNDPSASLGMYPPGAAGIPGLMLPGATQAARTPSLADSSAQERAKGWIPPLLAA